MHGLSMSIAVMVSLIKLILDSNYPFPIDVIPVFNPDVPEKIGRNLGSHAGRSISIVNFAESACLAAV